MKLNQKFHPNLLFEANMSYKLGTNSAPDDSLRSYNISEDLLQLNTTFGYKAFRRWFYSANAQFKTQLLQSYNTNSTTLRSAFMSPGELNVGLGMTYDFTNKRNTFTFNTSIAPLSWQLRTCFSSRMNRANYNIKPGHHTVNKIGSSAEYKISWTISFIPRACSFSPTTSSFRVTGSTPSLSISTAISPPRFTLTCAMTPLLPELMKNGANSSSRRFSAST